jgi:hypothetical protein
MLVLMSHCPLAGKTGLTELDLGIVNTALQTWYKGVYVVCVKPLLGYCDTM